MQKRLRIILLAGMVQLFSFALFGQGFMPPITFNKAYTYSSPVEVFQLKATSDMSYIMAGIADTTDGPTKAIVTNMSCIGVPLWTTKLGYTEVNPDVVPYVIETSTSEYLAVFTMMDTLTNQAELAISKLNSNGGLVWTQVLSAEDELTSYRGGTVKETGSGDFVVTGTKTIRDSINNDVTFRDVLVMKLAGNGSVAWKNSYGDTLIGDIATEVVLDDGGNIYVTGETRLDPIGPAQGGLHAFVLRLDSLGNLVAAKSFGGFGPQAVTRARDIYFTANNELILTGMTTVIDENNIVLPADIFTLQVDTALLSATPKIYSPSLVNDGSDAGNKIIPKDGGGYALAADMGGTVLDSADVNGGALLFLDNDLNVEGARFYDNITGGTSVSKAMDEGYAIGGTNIMGDESIPVLVKTDGDFASGCEETDFDISSVDGNWRADTLEWMTTVIADTLFMDTVEQQVTLTTDINCENIPENNAEFDYTGFCWNELFEFENLSTGDIQNYAWNFGDGIGSSQDENPGPYNYQDGGTYSVSLTVSYECVTSTFTLPVVVKKEETNINIDTCVGAVVEVAGRTIEVDGQGLIVDFTETFTDVDGCDSLVNVRVTGQDPTIEIDTLQCAGVPLQIADQTFTSEQDTIVNESFTFVDEDGCISEYDVDITWNINEISLPDTIACPGQTVTILGMEFTPQRDPYVFELEDVDGCITRYRLVVEEDDCICELKFPNAFTPGPDTLNQSFGALYRCVNSEIVDFQLKVFSRWGEEVFVTNDIDERWDGTCESEDCPADMYVWYAVYTERRNGVLQDPVTLKGEILVIR